MTYEGPERRKLVALDDVKLDAALDEVRKLHGKTTELAQAVSRTVPRQEVEARERQFKWILAAMGIATLIGVLLIPIMTRASLTGRLDRLDNGQRTTQCLQTKAEPERTASQADVAILTCSQKASR